MDRHVHSLPAALKFSLRTSLGPMPQHWLFCFYGKIGKAILTIRPQLLTPNKEDYSFVR